MTPFQQELLAVLGGVRDALNSIVVLMPAPTRMTIKNTETVTPPTVSVAPAGECDLLAAFPGGEPHT